MRILKVTQIYFPYLNLGGPPAKVRAIARALVSHGYEVTVLTADRGEGREVAITPQGQNTAMTGSVRTKGRWGWETDDDGVQTIYLPTLRNYRASTLNPRILRFCKARLRDYDVVHIYGLYDLLGWTVAWFCRRHQIPYVLEPLGMFGPKVRSQKKKNLYHQLAGRKLFAAAKTVIATSEKERRELIDGGVSNAKIVLRGNGINLDEFRDLPRAGAFRSRYNINVDIPLAVFVGRLSFIKGLDLLVHAFAGVENNARMIIAGPDDGDGCLTEVRKLIEQLRLDDRVSVIRPLYGQAKLEALVDADFVVLPSRYESFGNVAAEAIACGTPVLVTSECGIAPLLKDKAGIVVDCDVEAISQGLKRMIGEPDLLARLREACPGVALNLSWEAPIRAMEDLYRSMTVESRVPRRAAAIADNAQV